MYLGRYQGHRVAIKIFKHDAAEKRIMRELELLRSITCPHLVRLVADTEITVSSEPCRLVAYEYHSGGDLSQRLVADPAPLDQPTLLRLAFEVGGAVDTLWKHRIVHRDIKPANILLDGQGSFILADIGLARHIDLSTVTAPGRLVGTPGYMSPEQAKGRKNLTSSSDIFSLGLTLYEAAARAHPFQRRQELIGRSPSRPLTELRGDLDAAFTDGVDRMLVFQPAERPRSTVALFRHFM